jgi:hypothetical protein
MEAIKFSRFNFTEADAAKVNAARSAGAVTEALRSAATETLMGEMRKMRLAIPKEDGALQYGRVMAAFPNLVQLVLEPLLVGGYVEKIENVEEV